MTSSPSVHATIGYLHAPDHRPYNYAYEPPDGEPWQNYEQDARMVPIADARLLPAPASVDKEGFTLIDAPTSLRDFRDPDTVARRYYPEVAELACAATGAARAHVFDHLVRECAQPGRTLGFGRPLKGEPARANGGAHCDYTEESGRKRLEMVLGQDAPSVDGKRYAIVNVWRSIRAVVLDTPLAVCDARSVDVRDLVSADVRYPRRVGQIYLARHSARHHWFYYSTMDLHEALVFKQYDSQLGGVARFTPHAAFDHPHAPPSVPPRISIETRCLVIYD